MATSDGLLEAFIAIRDRIAGVVLRIAPPEEVEDIVQETYVRVCQSKNKSAIRQPRSFLFRTAQNLALDHMKRAETRLTSPSDQIDDFDFAMGEPVDATFEKVASDERFSQFCEAVRRLPQQCRRAFVLKKVYGRTQREIAAEMGISENVVENYIALGMKRCEVTLAELRQKQPARANGVRTKTGRRSAPGGEQQ